MSNYDNKKIWIDLDNSPHVPFFKPIIDELEKRGYSLMITARDCFQVCGLADVANIKYKRIGKHYGKHKVLRSWGRFSEWCSWLLPCSVTDRQSRSLTGPAASRSFRAFCGFRTS